MFQTQTTQVSRLNSGHLSELIHSVDFDNRYMDQSRDKKPKTRASTIPGPPGKDEYDYRQDQRGHLGEGSSRPKDPRVQQSSQRPDPRPSHSIPQPMAQDRNDYTYDRGREEPSRMERESSKGDKHSQNPPKDMFNPYSSSYSTAQRRREEDSSDDSDSSSGYRTTGQSSRSGKGVRSKGDHKTRSKAPSMQTRPPLDHRGLSDPSGISKSKLQPWVAEPSSYKDKESARLPVQQSASRDSRGKGADTDFGVGGYRGEGKGVGGPSGPSMTMSQQQPWGVGQPAATGDSQNRSGHKEKERDRSSMQQSSSRPDPRSKGTNDDYGVGAQGSLGNYPGPYGSYSSTDATRVTGQPAAMGDGQSRLSRKEKEKDLPLTQQSSSRPDQRSKGTNDDYGISGQGTLGSYRGEGGGGISGHPSDSQNRSGYKEKDSARLPVQQSSSRDPRGKEADTAFGVGSYRGEGVGPSGMSKTMSQQPRGTGQPAASSDSQSQSRKEKEKDLPSTQQSSSRPDPRSRGTNDNYGVGGQGSVGGYRGEVGGGISGHPSDSQTRSGYKEKESPRLSVQQSSSQDPRVKGADTAFGVGSYRGEGVGGPSGPSKTMSQQPWGTGQPAATGDSQSRSSRKDKEKDLPLTQQSSSRPDPRSKGTKDDYGVGGQGSLGSYRGEGGGGISGHPSDSQNRSGYKEKESARLPVQQSSSRSDPRAPNIPTETKGTTAHSSKFPPNPTTPIPQRKEEDNSPYNTRGSGRGKEGSNQPADPSLTKPYGPYSSTDTTRSPQHQNPYSHPSQVQGSLGSQRPENTLGGEPSRSSGWDPRLNPPAGPTVSHSRSGQPTAPPSGWSANPPHRVFFSTSLR